MHLYYSDPLTLKMSLRVWLMEMTHQARGRSVVSTRRLGHMLYSRRALKLREFVALMAADSFAGAVCSLTGAQVG